MNRFGLLCITLSAVLLVAAGPAGAVPLKDAKLNIEHNATDAARRLGQIQPALR